MLKRAPSDGSFLVRKKNDSEYAISFRYTLTISNHYMFILEVWYSVAKKLRACGYHPRGKFTICEVSEGVCRGRFNVEQSTQH
jgi:hypothetical protein